MTSHLLRLFASVVLPLLTIVFLVIDWSGGWDRFFGLNHVEAIAARLETSYAKNIDRQIGPDEDGWKPLLRLIEKYSNVQLPKDLEPKVLARSVAIQSAQMELGQGEIAEWTAPATPIILLYETWPGNKVSPEKYRVVGTIGDLRVWINQSRNDFRFMVQYGFFAVFSVFVGFIAWLGEYKMNKNKRSEGMAEADIAYVIK